MVHPLSVWHTWFDYSDLLRTTSITKHAGVHPAAVIIPAVIVGLSMSMCVIIVVIKKKHTRNKVKVSKMHPSEAPGKCKSVLLEIITYIYRWW